MLLPIYVIWADVIAHLLRLMADVMPLWQWVTIILIVMVDVITIFRADVIAHLLNLADVMPKCQLKLTLCCLMADVIAIVW